jgi:hypothetical protein
MIDRELYLPKGWIEDRDRCWAAGIPDETIDSKGCGRRPRVP